MCNMYALQTIVSLSNMDFHDSRFQEWLSVFNVLSVWIFHKLEINTESGPNPMSAEVNRNEGWLTSMFALKADPKQMCGGAVALSFQTTLKKQQLETWGAGISWNSNSSSGWFPLPLHSLLSAHCQPRSRFRKGAPAHHCQCCPQLSQVLHTAKLEWCRRISVV